MPARFPATTPMRSALLVLCTTLSFGSAAFAQVHVDGAWIRPTVAGQSVGGGYLSLRSDRADRLLGVSTPAAASVELHTVAMVGDVMQMRQLDAVELPAGKKVEFKPGGLHLMLLGLKQPLMAGAKLPVTLRFEKAGELKAELLVAPKAPEAGEHKH